jgi:hypothetical protein
MKNKPLPSPAPVGPASRAEVERFLKGLQEFRGKGIDQADIDEADVKNYDEAGVKAYLDKMSVGSQQGIARRIMMDIMKAPTKPPEPKRKPTRKKPTKKKPTKKKKTSPKAKSTRTSKKRSPAKKKKAGRRR